MNALCALAGEDPGGRDFFSVNLEGRAEVMHLGVSRLGGGGWIDSQIPRVRFEPERCPTKVPFALCPACFLIDEHYCGPW